MLHALGEDEPGGAAQLPVVLEHEAGVEAAAVAGQPGGAGVARDQRLERGLAGGDPRPDGVVDPFEPQAGGQAQAGGVAGDQEPVGHQLGHGVVAALGDQVGGELLQLAAGHERGDGGVGLQVGDEVLRAPSGRREAGEVQHHADGDRVEVGVEEPTARHRARATQDLDVGPLVADEGEALLDLGPRQGQHLLHPQREVLGPRMSVQPGLLGQERVDPVTGDHDGRPHLAPRPVGAHADGAGSLAHEAGGGGRGDQHGAGGLSLPGQPGIEVGAQRRAAVVRGAGPGLGSEVDAQRLRGREHHRRPPGDPALDRHLLPPARDELVEDPAVHDAAVHVLAAGERAPLEEGDVPAGASQHQGGGGARRPGSDHDRIKRFSHRRWTRSPAVRPARPGPAWRRTRRPGRPCSSSGRSGRC